MTAEPRRQRNFGFTEQSLDEKENQVSTRSVRTNSSSSTTPSTAGSRKARFAEATSVMSPASGPGEHRMPFTKSKSTDDGPKPSDVGFGYISDNQPTEQFATVRSDPNGKAGQPLKSALKTPGTASRLLDIRSPTFKEELALEKQEESTDEQQAKDLVSPSTCPYSPT